MSRRLALAVVAVLVVSASAARAQERIPTVRDVNQRSGLITRHVPIVPNLPPDPDRDRWYLTRWGDNHEEHDGINSIKNSGFYGRRWESGCTACFSPYFAGSQGQNTLNHTCENSNFRLISNFVHPFKPVCTYYANGCFVPVYDFDPVVPGPGPFPFRHFFKRPTGG